MDGMFISAMLDAVNIETSSEMFDTRKGRILVLLKNELKFFLIRRKK